MPDSETPATWIAPIARLRPDAEDRLARVPPCNTDAEQVVLGALLIDNRIWDRVADLLKPAYFANALHGRILEAIVRLIERGHTANPITLKDAFDQDGALQTIGGARYLGQLAAAAAMIGPIEDYARAVRDLYFRRELIGLAGDLSEAAFKTNLDDTAEALIERTESQLYHLADSGESGSSWVSISDAMMHAIVQGEAAYKRGADIVGVPTGFTDLDKLLGGLHPSDLVILAGRPSMGKSVLAENIGMHAAQNGVAAAMFSLEMAQDQLGARELGGAAGISSNWMRSGDLNQRHFDMLMAAQRRYVDVPFLIDDTAALAAPALRTRARRLKRKRHDLGLVIIDYLQLVQPGTTPRAQNRVQEVSEITQALKALAKELHVAVLAISQLSRAVEARDEKRPLLSDLRDSGSIEQDADVVIFLYREEYYLREPDRADAGKWGAWRDKLNAVRNKAEIIVAKHRHGPTGTVALHFDHRTTRFSNLA
ncbi:MAG TPA: replicative DNA helicase [Stellaceae bacterium]|jgi:replicative DNA helicase